MKLALAKSKLPRTKLENSIVISVEDLEQIPGIGEKIAREIQGIGITSVSSLKGQNAEQLYEKLCDFKASPVDRCMLYVFRCAIYYAENTQHDPDLLKWWNWKD